MPKPSSLSFLTLISSFLPKNMHYKANLIRASNAPEPPNYSRRRNVEAAPWSRQPQSLQFLPPLPPGYIFYGVQQDVQVQTSIIDGAIAGHEQRLSPETISTLHELQLKIRRRRSSDKIASIYYDKDSPGFEWLLDGWLVEKRILTEDSHYWVYYDPLGRQYRSKQQVLRFWKEQNYYSSANEKVPKAR